ncbi:MAG: helix-turn-helix transcriptional regulator [Lachnospiraceae bacterium]|nr:helix-turn-helix transcriptional regulator [Lachnospiraceae bacterium]
MRLTQEELANKIHVSKSAIAKWETDAGIPERDNLQRLAKAINVSVDDLHRIIGTEGVEDIDYEVNITPEVIAVLESYGYKVIRPETEGKNDME